MYHLEKSNLILFGHCKHQSTVNTWRPCAATVSVSHVVDLLLFFFTPCGKKGSGRRSVSLTCLKCLSHLILDSSEKCSPGWKDEAIQNGNIYYPPSQHSFYLFLSVWVNYGELPSEMSSCFTKKQTSCFLFSSFCLENGFEWHHWFCFNLKKASILLSWWHFGRCFFLSVLYVVCPFSNPLPKLLTYCCVFRNGSDTSAPACHFPLFQSDCSASHACLANAHFTAVTKNRILCSTTTPETTVVIIMDDKERFSHRRSWNQKILHILHYR